MLEIRAAVHIFKLSRGTKTGPGEKMQVTWTVNQCLLHFCNYEKINMLSYVLHKSLYFLKCIHKNTLGNWVLMVLWSWLDEHEKYNEASMGKSPGDFQADPVNARD